MAKLIEISGIDGSGKTTAVKTVADGLERLGFRVLRNREVGSFHNPTALKLREVVLSNESDISGTEMEMVFAAMRLMNQRIYDKLDKEYDFIVNDRGFLDHLAYTNQNVNPEFTQGFYKDCLDKNLGLMRMPDAAIFMNVTPSVASDRRDQRGEAKDRIESQGNTYQQKVYEYMHEEFADMVNDHRISHLFTVNSDRTLKEVNETLEDIIRFLARKAAK
jgi:dTMP kinase